MTVLFPWGGHPDVEVRARLRALEWPVPFVLDFLSEPFARPLLPEGASIPALLLVSDEGRLLFQSRFAPDAMPELVATLDAAFPEHSVATAGERGGSSPR